MCKRVTVSYSRFYQAVLQQLQGNNSVQLQATQHSSLQAADGADDTLRIDTLYTTTAELLSKLNYGMRIEGPGRVGRLSKGDTILNRT